MTAGTILIPAFRLQEFVVLCTLEYDFVHDCVFGS